MESPIPLRDAPVHADDAEAASPPAARTVSAALASAGRLLSHAGSLTPLEWHDVVQRARTLDPIAHRRALRTLSHALTGHPQTRALDALNRGACEAANGAMSMAPVGGSSAQSCTYAGRIAAHAVLALALATELPREDVDLLTLPFRRRVRPAAAPRLAIERAD